jgi:putative tricarboxylic transport membrane protein
MIENLFLGFAQLAAWDVLLALVTGVLVGYFVGAMPGITSSIGMALLIPFTFGMSPVAALVLLVTVYMASEYAGAIPAILVNAPGVPAAAVTAFDGYPMAQQGRAGEALALSILGSGAGALISTALLVVSASVMAGFALAFGPAEYAALALLGLSLITTLSSGPVLRSLIGLLFGLLVVTIGIDPSTGDMRFVFTEGLIDGVDFLPALIGLFALAEVFFMLESLHELPPKLKTLGGLTGSLSVLRGHWLNVWRSSIVGYVIGVIPGAGATIAGLVSYGMARRASKEPDSFGSGNPAGVVASETANNAAVSGSLAPLLALGIPGSSSAAVLIGALTIHGLAPGPLLFANDPQIPYSIFAALFVGLPIMVAVGLLGARLWVKVTEIPNGLIAAAIAAICVLGAYAGNNYLFDVWVAVFFGILGYILRKAHIHPAPIVLALVLGYMFESNFRRAMAMSNDNLAIFLTNPLAATIIVLALVTLVSPLLRFRRRAAQPASA